MKYSKPAVSFPDQIVKLSNRGLTISNTQYAQQCLSNISYYRLRAYTHPFQDNSEGSDHHFLIPVTFEQIIELYRFDRELRLLVMNAIEKIEVALRTQIVYQWAMTHGSHWYTNPAFYKNRIRFEEHIAQLEKEVNRSSLEEFIDHYRKTYSDPPLPPSWMSLEVTSFGLLSKLFKNLSGGKEKRTVADYFGIDDVILESWMYNISAVRNISAHHSRLWNRVVPKVMLPKKPSKLFISHKVDASRLYASLCCMQYMLQSITPCCGFKDELKRLMKTCPLNQERIMDFPPNWKQDPFWN